MAIQLKFQKWFRGVRKVKDKKTHPLIGSNSIQEHISTLEKKGSVLWGQFCNKSQNHRNYFSRVNVEIINNAEEPQFLYLLSDYDANYQSVRNPAQGSSNESFNFLRTSELYKCKIKRIILPRTDQGKLVILDKNIEQYIPTYYNNGENNYKIFDNDETFEFTVGAWILITSIEEVPLSYLNYLRKDVGSPAVSEIESYFSRVVSRYVEMYPDNEFKSISRSKIHNYVLPSGTIFPYFISEKKHNAEFEFDEDMFTLQLSTSKTKEIDEAYLEYIVKKKPIDEYEGIHRTKLSRDLLKFEQTYTMYDYSVEVYDEVYDEVNEETEKINTENTDKWVKAMTKFEPIAHEENKENPRIPRYKIVIVSEKKYTALTDDNNNADDYVYANLTSMYGSGLEVKCFLNIKTIERCDDRE